MSRKLFSPENENGKCNRRSYLTERGIAVDFNGWNIWLGINAYRKDHSSINILITLLKEHNFKIKCYKSWVLLCKYVWNYVSYFIIKKKLWKYS